MTSLLHPAIGAALDANNLLFESLPREAGSVVWLEIQNSCGFTLAQLNSLIRFRCEPQHFFIDLDGCIEGRRENPMSWFERLRFAASGIFQPGLILSENYVYNGDVFEGHKVCLRIQHSMLVIKFRPGTYDLLKGLSALGQVHFFTHACERFATRVTRFLNRVVKPSTRFTCRCFRRPLLKSLGVGVSSVFVLDDHIERWQSQTVTHRCPTMIYGPDCGRDVWLYALMIRHCDIFRHSSLVVNTLLTRCPFLTLLPFDILLYVLSFALRDRARHLVFCPHFNCHAVKLAGVGVLCSNCGLRSSESSA